MSSTLPRETLTTIFKLLLPSPEAFPNLISHHFRRSTLLSCSLVSRQWREAALPIVWVFLILDCYDIRAKAIFERLVFHLTDSCLSTRPGLVHGFGFVTSIVLCLRPDRSDWPELLLPLVGILQFLSPGQLSRLAIEYSIAKQPSLSVLLSTLFPGLTRNLKRLQVKGISAFGQEGDIILQHLPESIESLEIDCLSKRHTPEAISLDHIFALRNIHNLKLANFGNASHSKLEQSLRTWGPQMSVFRIVDCPNLFRDSLPRALADHCPNLVDIGLEAGPEVPQHITDDALCHLIDSCRLLEDLRLSNICAVSDRFLALCASRSRFMRRLFIKNPSLSLTGEGISDFSAWTKMESIFIFSPAYDLRIHKDFVRLIEEQLPRLSRLPSSKGYQAKDLYNM